MNTRRLVGLASLAFLALAALPSAQAQGVPFGISPTHQASKQATAFSPWTATGAVAGWSASTASFAAGYGEKGTYLTSSGNTFSRTSGAIPGVSGGALSFPVTLMGYCTVTNTASGGTVLEICDSDGPPTCALTVGISTTMSLTMQDAMGSGAIQTSASTVTSARWHLYVVVAKNDSDWSVYLGTDTTGANTTATFALTSLSQIHYGYSAVGYNELAGQLGPQWVFSGVDLSGAGNAAKRLRFFKGDNPEASTVCNATATAYYKFDNDAGADAKGSFGLTATGSPTAQSKVVCLRDRVSNTYHLLNSPADNEPTFDASYFGGTGGMDCSSAVMLCSATPVSGLPVQAYVGYTMDDYTDSYPTLLTVGSAFNSCNIEMHGEGATANTPSIRTVTTATGEAIMSSTGPSAGNPGLLWGLVSSAAARQGEINGAGGGSNSTSCTATTATTISLGGLINAGFAHDGKLAFAVLLNTSSTSQQADFEAWSTSEIGAP